MVVSSFSRAWALLFGVVANAFDWEEVIGFNIDFNTAWDVGDRSKTRATWGVMELERAFKVRGEKDGLPKG